MTALPTILALCAIYFAGFLTLAAARIALERMAQPL